MGNADGGDRTKMARTLSSSAVSSVSPLRVQDAELVENVKWSHKFRIHCALIERKSEPLGFSKRGSGEASSD